MADLDDTTRAEVEAAICAGRKLDAIRLYREALPDTELVGAKKAVEEMEARLRQEHPENFGPPTTKTGCLGLVIAIAGEAGTLGILAGWVVVWS